MTTIRRTAAVLSLLLVVAACGDGQTSAEIPPVGDDAPSVAGGCLEGTIDCNDTLFPGDEPQGDLPPDVPFAPLPAGEGLSVAEALETDVTGALVVHGYFYDGGSGPMLCEFFAESFPPQCGGASIPLADVSEFTPETLQTNQGISWSDDEVILLGEIVDGVLVPSEMSL